MLSHTHTLSLSTFYLLSEPKPLSLLNSLDIISSKVDIKLLTSPNCTNNIWRKYMWPLFSVILSMFFSQYRCTSITPIAIRILLDGCTYLRRLLLKECYQLYRDYDFRQELKQKGIVSDPTLLYQNTFKWLFIRRAKIILVIVLRSTLEYFEGFLSKRRAPLYSRISLISLQSNN